MKTRYFFLLFFMVLGVGYISTAFSAPVNTTPTTALEQPLADTQPKVTLPLSGIIKKPYRTYSYTELKERFNQFKHVPFDKSGYNIFMLPFRFKSDNPKDNNREALAFSFLLSNALDWGDANYCTRHAYFAFKRSQKIIKPLTERYYRNYISHLIRDWGATAAVGGILKKSDKGFTCSVFMYDPAGKTIWKKSYPQPMDYFELLGQVATDILRQLGEKVSPELEKLLKQKRCNNHQSILDLGVAAFAEEKSKQEFGLYKKILTRDPDFAEVRYWWSNQQYWVDNDKANNALETARSFESYPNEESFRCFKPEDCPNEAIVEKSKQWPAIVERLLGSDSYILMARIVENSDAKDITPELLVKMTQIGEKYPNQYWYLYNLGSLYAYIHDYYYEISIALAGMHNNYVVAIDRRCISGLIAYAAKHLGYNDLAIQYAKPIVDKYIKNDDYSTIAWEAYRLGEALCSMGHYKEAADYFITSFHGYKEGDYWERWALSEACFCALLAGDEKLVNEILEEKTELLKQTGMLYIINLYRDIINGKAVTVDDFHKNQPKDSDHNNYSYCLHQILLCSQIELLQKTKKPSYRDAIGNWANGNPGERLLWIIFDQYDRFDPKPQSSFFYETMDWLHGDDPWVQQAVSDFKKRSKFIDPPSIEEIRNKLKDFPPQQWPNPIKNDSLNNNAKSIDKSFPVFAISARIARLVKNGDFDTAEELAKRYQSLAYAVEYDDLCAFTKQLEYLVQNEKQKHNTIPESMPTSAPTK